VLASLKFRSWGCSLYGLRCENGRKVSRCFPPSETPPFLGKPRSGRGVNLSQRGENISFTLLDLEFPHYRPLPNRPFFATTYDRFRKPVPPKSAIRRPKLIAPSVLIFSRGRLVALRTSPKFTPNHESKPTSLHTRADFARQLKKANLFGVASALFPRRPSQRYCFSHKDAPRLIISGRPIPSIPQIQNRPMSPFL